MRRSSLVRLALATCASLFIAAWLIWMASSEAEYSSTARAVLPVPGIEVPAENSGVSRVPQSADDVASAAILRQRDGDEDAIYVRVVDSSGAPMQGIPVGIVGAQDFVDHPFDFLMDCLYQHPCVLEQPHLLWLRSDQGAVQTKAGRLRPPGSSMEWTKDSPWHDDGERNGFAFHRAFLARATSDEHGALRLPWNRVAEPRVFVRFAFPTSRQAEVHELHAKHSQRESVVMRMPLVERVAVTAEHDLAHIAPAQWKARISAACTLRDHSPLQVAWDEPVEIGTESPATFLFERGMKIRVEAALDAPMASVVLREVAPVIGKTSSFVFRTSECYGAIRARVLDGRGEPLAGERIELSRTCRNSSDELFRDLYLVDLDAEGKFQIWMPAARSPHRARTLRVLRYEALDPLANPARMDFRKAKVEELTPPALVGIRRRREFHRECYLDLTNAVEPGRSRDVGPLQLGRGPRVIAGRALWDDGKPITAGGVILPAGSTPEPRGLPEGLPFESDGRFVLPGVPAVDQLELIVYSVTLREIARVAVSTGREDLELRVPRRGGVSGSVLLDAWVPIELEVHHKQGEITRAKSQVNGRFLVQDHPVGRSDVAFAVGGIELTRVRGIELTSASVEQPELLRAVDLRPFLSKAVIELRGNGSKLCWKQLILTDPDGRFRLEERTAEDGQLRCLLPNSVRRLHISVVGFRDIEVEVQSETTIVSLEREG